MRTELKLKVGNDGELVSYDENKPKNKLIVSDPEISWKLFDSDEAKEVLKQRKLEEDQAKVDEFKEDMVRFFGWEAFDMLDSEITMVDTVPTMRWFDVSGLEFLVFGSKRVTLIGYDGKKQVYACGDLPLQAVIDMVKRERDRKRDRDSEKSKNTKKTSIGAIVLLILLVPVSELLSSLFHVHILIVAIVFLILFWISWPRGES